MLGSTQNCQQCGKAKTSPGQTCVLTGNGGGEKKGRNIFSRLFLWPGCGPSEPGVPGGVHATQVVQAVGRGHQGVDFALSALKLSQVVEAGHDGRDGLLDQRHQLLGVHVLWLAGRGQRHGRVLLGLLVPGDDLVAEDRLQDAVDLPGTRDPLKPCT